MTSDLRDLYTHITNKLSWVEKIQTLPPQVADHVCQLYWLLFWFTKINVPLYMDYHKTSFIPTVAISVPHGVQYPEMCCPRIIGKVAFCFLTDWIFSNIRLIVVSFCRFLDLKRNGRFFPFSFSRVVWFLSPLSSSLWAEVINFFLIANVQCEYVVYNIFVFVQIQLFHITF